MHNYSSSWFRMFLVYFYAFSRSPQIARTNKSLKTIFKIGVLIWKKWSCVLHVRIIWVKKSVSNRKNDPIVYSFMSRKQNSKIYKECKVIECTLFPWTHDVYFGRYIIFFKLVDSILLFVIRIVYFYLFNFKINSI